MKFGAYLVKEFISLLELRLTFTALHLMKWNYGTKKQIYQLHLKCILQYFNDVMGGIMLHSHFWLLSTPPSFLSTPRSFLSTHRSFLSTSRSFLSTPRSFLSTHRSLLSSHRSCLLLMDIQCQFWRKCLVKNTRTIALRICADLQLVITSAGINIHL